MMQRNVLLTKYPTVSEGTEVYGCDNERLGKIIQMNDDYFVVEKGLFFPRDFTLRYDDIEEVRDNQIYLKLRTNELEEWRSESYPGWSQVEDINESKISAEPLPEYRERYTSRPLEEEVKRTEDTRVPIMEEKIDTQRHLRQTGEVSLRKVVHTELKHFTIPVMKEEVIIERRPVTSETEPTRLVGETAFQEKTIKVPVMEEEVTISKRPVVTEEVHVRKDRVTEQREVSEEIKKEEVEIQEEGRIPKRKVG